MAKNKKTKKSTDKPEGLNKVEIRAFYKENGWKETVSKFSIAPKDLSPIVKGKKAEGSEKPLKKRRKSADKDGAPSAPKKKVKGKGKKGGKVPEAPYGYKKDGTPRKPPGRKSGEKPVKAAKATKPQRSPKVAKAPKVKSASKKGGRRPKRQDAAAPAAATDSMVLDWLLNYRARKPRAEHMLDSIIIDLTTRIRK